MVHLPSEPFFCWQIRTARPVPVAKVEKQQLSHLGLAILWIFSQVIEYAQCGKSKYVEVTCRNVLLSYIPILLI